MFGWRCKLNVCQGCQVTSNNLSPISMASGYWLRVYHAPIMINCVLLISNNEITVIFVVALPRKGFFTVTLTYIFVVNMGCLLKETSRTNQHWVTPCVQSVQVLLSTGLDPFATHLIIIHFIGFLKKANSVQPCTENRGCWTKSLSYPYPYRFVTRTCDTTKVKASRNESLYTHKSQ